MAPEVHFHQNSIVALVSAVLVSPGLTVLMPGVGNIKCRALEVGAPPGVSHE